MFMKFLSGLGNRVWQGVQGDCSDRCGFRSRRIRHRLVDPPQLPEYRPGHIGHKRYFAAVVNRVTLQLHMYHAPAILHFGSKKLLLVCWNTYYGKLPHSVFPVRAPCR